ncbi:polysaccharide export protein [Altererythrobacter soli]|uniref:Polysaccharide export protein n=1 Tax=Croceibacterium soli TaxID=1739690 RepID=A0A6I4UR47_9SPHN|nr:polysaccharide biosynthesis/export family protein [Croceibacterium soli]MXP41372.1 polysaccharide export protein [Croceibacterium soli]
MADLEPGDRRSAEGHGYRRKAAVGLFALAALSLAGCASTNIPTASVIEANTGVEQGYTISSGDKIRVTVFDEENLTGDYQVGLAGDVQLPLIGRIVAAGETSTTLAEMIATMLRDGSYVLSPRVAVEVAQHRPFFILGEVKTPGEYVYASNMTLEQAVAKAGGFTPRADKGVVILRRQTWSTPRKVRLDGETLLVSPGDTILVQEAFF